MTKPAVRHLIDITSDLLAGQPPDSGPPCGCRTHPGRLHVWLACALCHSQRHWDLPRGRWAVDHRHDGSWTAHVLRLNVPGDEPPTPPPVERPRPAEYDVAALAAALAPTLAAARR
jgi:hypothetical protein